MTIFVLNWNPDKWEWPSGEYAEAVRATAAGGTWPRRWSLGVRKSGIHRGDRAVLLRQGRDRGLVGHGIFTSEVITAPHWDGSGRLVPQGLIEWDSIVEIEDRLPTEMLKETIPEVTWDNLPGSGVAVPAGAAQRLEDLWDRHTGGTDASAVLRRLVNVPLSTTTGRRNIIVDVMATHVQVATERSPDGQPVPIYQVQAGLDRLLRTGELEVSVPSLGHRSSFIGAVLRTLPGAVLVRTEPPRIQLVGAEASRQVEPVEAKTDNGRRGVSGPGLGSAYRQAQVSASPAVREPFTVDPALVERGLRGHADTQNELARVLSAAGIEPRSPMSGEPNFDLAWQNEDTIFVAEVKSITDDNEEEQLRLGLGQVLRYRQRLASLGYQHVVAVLVPERQPRDPSWSQLCDGLGVALLWRDELERALTLGQP